MEHYNYCGYALADYKKFRRLLEENAKPSAIIVSDFLHKLLHKSQKFIMPEHGLVRDLSEDEIANLKCALDDSKLPYDCVSLEYSSFGKQNIILAFAKNLIDDSVKFIFDYDSEYYFWHFVREKYWLPHHYGGFLRKDVDIFDNYTELLLKSPILLGEVGLELLENDMEDFVTNMDEDSNLALYFKDLQNSAMTLLLFLNAINCSNVTVEKASPAKRSVLQKTSPKAYYEHHFLRIDTNSKNVSSVALGGSHASPREHVRRGHVRRLADGKTIWINDTVVNAGTEYKIDKTYCLNTGQHTA